ncbi:MAG: putrescine aminotransferase [Desulfuromonadaceae bacterium]|nr:putrescine aminotransferase [Desulfuromonadaceae bacterium]MDD5105111.1 putrescine aminotransferase [Desulfuromonadaceae bacterium]
MSRNVEYAQSEAKRMLDLLLMPEDQVPAADKARIEQDTVENFANHINKGWLKYRKSMTEAGDFASVEWTGQGSMLTDTRGREFIDVLGGFGLYSAGIRHPKIVAAAKAQLDRSPQYSQEMLDPLRAHLGKVLANILPGDIQYGFFINSGTEAVDGAMKLAKLYTGKAGFIATEKAFHGKTLGPLTLMGKSTYREPLLPLLANVRHVPFGNADAVEQVLASAKQVGDGIAAMVVEPIQGEAGAIIPPDDYFPRLREICDRYGVLLIADEVQTGLGRTGTLFGVDHWNVTPDIICLGKALGGGVIPCSGFFSTAKIWECMEPNPFMHSTTTGGNPIACAAALAYINVLLEEDLAGQAKAKGEYILEKLVTLKAKYPNVLAEVRGKGLLIGMDFATDEMGWQFASGMFTRQVLTAGTFNNARTIRIEPALNISYELIDRMLVILEEVLVSINSDL